MPLVFAVFLITVLLVFAARSQERSRRLAWLTARFTSCTQTIRTAVARGTETLERASARLAPDQRRRVGLDELLTWPEPSRVDPLGGNSEYSES